MMHHVRSEQARKRARNNSCKTSEVYSRAAAIQISRSPWKWWKDARFFKEGGRNPNSKHIWPIDHIYLCACVRTLGTWHVSIISLAQDFEHVLWQASFAGHTTLSVSNMCIFCQSAVMQCCSDLQEKHTTASLIACCSVHASPIDKTCEREHHMLC